MIDWQELIGFIHDLETQAAVAKYAAEPPEGDEERGEPGQVRMWKEA